MNRYVLIFLVAAMSIAACGTSRKLRKDPQTAEAIAHKPFMFEVKAVIQDTAQAGKDAYKLSKSRINGDTLFVDVEYSGGCKDHVFTARHNGQYMKSMPAQLNLMIDHNGNADACRELIKETLAFDLRGARYGSSGSLILLLNGERSNKITYTY
jgi:hypothetical protein